MYPNISFQPPSTFSLHCATPSNDWSKFKCPSLVLTRPVTISSYLLSYSLHLKQNESHKINYRHPPPNQNQYKGGSTFIYLRAIMITGDYTLNQ